MPFHLLKGTFHVVNYAPDGDTIRFNPDDPALLANLSGAPAKLNPRGHVSLRLEGLDTLETHYNGLKQPAPFADDATDALLAAMAIANVKWSRERRSVASADDGVRGHVMARACDKYGRVIAFAFPGDPPEPDGAEVFLDTARLENSANFMLVANGLAYGTFYWGLFADLRAHLSGAAAQARSAGGGLYGADRTNTGFAVVSLETLTDDVVMLPKLFRRLSTYVTETGGAAGFKAALEANGEPVLDLTTNNFTHFDTFIEETDGEIRLTRLPETMVFDPMPERLKSDFQAVLSAAATPDMPAPDSVPMDQGDPSFQRRVAKARACLP